MGEDGGDEGGEGEKEWEGEEEDEDGEEGEGRKDEDGGDGGDDDMTRMIRRSWTRPSSRICWNSSSPYFWTIWCAVLGGRPPRRPQR